MTSSFPYLVSINNKRVYDVIKGVENLQNHAAKVRSFVNLRPLKAEFDAFELIRSCNVVQPSKEPCPYGIWLAIVSRRSIFVVQKRVSSQQRHLFAIGRELKAA